MELTNKIINFFTKLTFRSIPKPPYNHIVQLGDPVLRHKCKAVEKGDLQSKEFKELLHKLRKAVRRYKCAGLSAPQLGINMRVMAFTCPSESDYYGTSQEYHLKQMQPYPYTVWINPTLKVLDYSKVTFPEGCESMRGYSAEVARYTRVQLSGWDEEGRDRQQELSGWLARIAQHEMDHLDGKLYLDTAQLSTLICAFWNRVNQTGGKVHLSYYPNKILSKG
ncbi:peptide deformylase, mitochondrial-like [Macrosteles quadrilineatus]|uniref:peptide deformylase, mitochondrial-like n=1 Tax=Macrosteles quadrilineatus TaxID=74068 RepID=UPI0023E11710|nr:peptide deformylase, mitochondrial-like [Macrosteles quadrilineatus]XP_054271855.1 peptide deformylase, mitochondrial-like [Macrosteles quadrilineatus]